MVIWRGTVFNALFSQNIPNACSINFRARKTKKKRCNTCVWSIRRTFRVRNVRLAAARWLHRNARRGRVLRTFPVASCWASATAATKTVDSNSATTNEQDRTADATLWLDMIAGTDCPCDGATWPTDRATTSVIIARRRTRTARGKPN